MNLHILYVCGNYVISNEGIKHMKLISLDAIGNKRISNDCIKNMNLKNLNACCNKIRNKK